MQDHKVFPKNYESKSVVNALYNALKTQIIYQKIKEIDFINNKFKINQTYFDKLVIATGSNAYTKSSIDDNIGLQIATKFNHTILPLYPALVQLNLDFKYLNILAGLKQKAHVEVYINNKKIKSTYNDILFTKYGISGLAILDISTIVSKELLNTTNIKLKINLIPSYTNKELENKILSLKKNLPNYNFYSILDGFISSKLTNTILQIFNIDKKQTINQINTKTIKHIISKLNSWEFNIISTRNNTYAEVLGGGINIDEIDKTSMQSLKYKNLYFCGEILDIVGQRGGYNLHFAFASGYIAGKHLANL